MRLGAAHQPVHGAKHVFARGLHARVSLIVRQDDHVLALVTKALYQKGRKVAGVVDAALELSLLAKVVNADEQGLAAAGTGGILEGVVRRGAIAEMLGCLGRQRSTLNIVVGPARRLRRRRRAV